MPWGGIHPATAGELDRHGAISPYKDHQCPVCVFGIVSRHIAQDKSSQICNITRMLRRCCRTGALAFRLSFRHVHLQTNIAEHMRGFAGAGSLRSVLPFFSTGREQHPDKPPAFPAAPGSWSMRPAHQDTTRTQNSMFGIRNLQKPRELSQPNQLDMVGERGFEPPTPWSRTRCSTRLSHSPTEVSAIILLHAAGHVPPEQATSRSSRLDLDWDACGLVVTRHDSLLFPMKLRRRMSAIAGSRISIPRPNAYAHPPPRSLIPFLELD